MKAKTRKKIKSYSILYLALIVTAIALLLLFIFKGVKTDPFPVPYMDSLSWDNPTESSVYALINPDTDEEDVIFTPGTTRTAVIENSKADSFFDYYKNALIKEGFTQVSDTSSPQTDRYRVISYQKGRQWVELQFYPTPYHEDTFTISVFSGVLDTDPD